MNLILMRATALAVGFAAAGVGCYAAYEATAKADGGYLMVAAPIVALLAAFIPVFYETAFRDRQWIRGLALLVVWVPCAAVVFYSATERNHLAKAGAEAERSALRQVADRAKAELSGANAAKAAAIAAANKVRGVEGRDCKVSCLSIKATEQAAIDRADQAEKALAAAEARAITESETKQDDRLLPLALDLAGMILIGTGFRLGRMPAPPAPAPAEKAEAPAEAPAEKKDPRRVAAGIKAGRTKLMNRAIEAGTVTVLKKKK